MLALWLRANCQPAIWDNATRVEISEPHGKYIEVKCTALKYPDGSARF